jgi:hypothetical protein
VVEEAAAQTAALNREMLAQWSCIDWAAFGHDDDADPNACNAAAAPATAAVVVPVVAEEAKEASHSLNAQLKQERLRQEQNRSVCEASGAAADTAAKKRCCWNIYDDDTAKVLPRQWPPHMRVAYVSGADRMTIFDEWVWLVFIGNSGVTAYERAMQGKASRRDYCGHLTAARFLGAQKADVVLQQKDRLKAAAAAAGTNASDENEVARSRKQFDVMAPAFLRQPSSVTTVRAFSRIWCSGNVHVLQWLADHAGAPIALVHRGRGWVAEYLPRASRESVTQKYPPFETETETETEIEAMHIWRPASNCIVMYIDENAANNAGPAGGLVFGVELAPERIAQLPWVSSIVRLRSPYCAMTRVNKYSPEALQRLDARLSACRAAMRRGAAEGSGVGGGGGGKRVKKEEEEEEEEEEEKKKKKEDQRTYRLPVRRQALFKKILAALTAF